MDRFIKGAAESFFLIAVVAAVAMDTILYAVRGKGLVQRDGQASPVAAE